MATLNTSAATVECPVCKKPWVFVLEAKMSAKRGKPGQGVTTVKIKKPLRIPREHRDCIAKVD